MSAEEMMSRDQRTMTMSALGTAGEASGAEMTVPVGGYDVSSLSSGSGSTPRPWLPSKLPMGRGRTLAEAIIRWGKSIAGVAPFLSTIAHRRASQCNGPALSPPPPLS
jgi:hypothetical protein